MASGSWLTMASNKTGLWITALSDIGLLGPKLRSSGLKFSVKSSWVLEALPSPRELKKRGRTSCREEAVSGPESGTDLRAIAVFSVTAICCTVALTAEPIAASSNRLAQSRNFSPGLQSALGSWAMAGTVARSRIKVHTWFFMAAFPSSLGPDDQDAQFSVPFVPRHLPDLGSGVEVPVLLADLGGDRRRGLAHESELEFGHVGFPVAEDLLLGTGPQVRVGPSRVRHVAAGGELGVDRERLALGCDADLQRRAIGSVLVHLDRTHNSLQSDP